MDQNIWTLPKGIYLPRAKSFPSFHHAPQAIHQQVPRIYLGSDHTIDTTPIPIQTPAICGLDYCNSFPIGLFLVLLPLSSQDDCFLLKFLQWLPTTWSMKAKLHSLPQQWFPDCFSNHLSASLLPLSSYYFFLMYFY